MMGMIDCMRSGTTVQAGKSGPRLRANVWSKLREASDNETRDDETEIAILFVQKDCNSQNCYSHTYSLSVEWGILFPLLVRSRLRLSISQAKPRGTIRAGFVIPLG